ncbi:hypothetical protein [Aquimarina sediminis]|uniref:hypothetical protein n=1 Tax=Aquimarina sediminis TaxID=2070536 RepID=UPI000CA06A17|nr:hypothetical protein [Aquimarina sediminis]
MPTNDLVWTTNLVENSKTDPSIHPNTARCYPKGESRVSRLYKMTLSRTNRRVPIGNGYVTTYRSGVDTYGRTLNFGKQKNLTTMKNLKFIFVLALLLCANLISCTPDDSVAENETLHTEVLCTNGNNGEIDEGGELN